MTEAPSALARFIGAAMIAVGALITLLSGGCTGWFLLTSLASLFAARRSFDPYMILVSLVVGIPFIAIGVAFVAAGRRLLRGRRPSDSR